MFLDKKFIGAKLKEYRKKAKLSQEDIAEQVEIAEKHYGRLERGVCIPSLETFFKLIKILEIPLDEFGIETTKKDNNLRDKLIKEIYLLSNNEIEIYLAFVEAIKKFQN